jgi:hypothetical protein
VFVASFLLLQLLLSQPALGVLLLHLLAGWAV